MYTQFKPKKDEKIPASYLSYADAKLRAQLHNLILKAFFEEKISQKDLAARLDKKTSQISKLLGAPGNWTIETVAHLLFGINGNFLETTELCPNSQPIANDTQPSWLVDSVPYGKAHTINRAARTTLRSETDGTIRMKKPPVSFEAVN